MTASDPISALRRAMRKRLLYLEPATGGIAHAGDERAFEIVLGFCTGLAEIGTLDVEPHFELAKLKLIPYGIVSNLREDVS